MTDLQRRLSNALILRLLRGEPPEMAALQCVLEAAPAYYQSVTGAPPCGALAQSMFTALPPDKTYDDKFVWGLYAGDAMIGCADVIDISTHKNSCHVKQTRRKFPNVSNADIPAPPHHSRA